MKSGRLEGKTVIVTGAAGGIGTAIAALLDGEGANLVLADINLPRLEEMATGFSSPVLTVKCDITRREEVKALVARAREKFNTIDVLVNNAGIILPARFEESSYEDIDRQLNINLVGTINVTREVLPVLIENGGGNIVTISSMAGIVPETYSSIYTATKFALRGFNLTLALELKEYGIAVSTIFPDSTDTPMLRYEAAHGGSPLTFLSTPQSPEKVAEAVLRAITGRKPELYVPHSTGLVSKILMCAPGLVLKLWPRLEQSAQKNKTAYQRKYNIIEGKGERKDG
ncbi:MAG TPA: SDR family oxidoreductase [Bacillota bacterium]|jgi:short-subunit dehydrogenase|nr:SDR family oxidoreductase [Bacillota bacterium]HOB86639.1 SDR family oxidoreductase [Bacillota bacterium]HOP69373.1 SDR family oxidoreductase [Bacillota bacterium]HPT33716.1 SDR family oxidoreductase [Bacillota bacterium]HPZ64862.1 SDR family oxidoreductase [Bacillota bacterium]